MVRIFAGCTVLLLLLAGTALGEESISCRGNITSKQGEGLVVRTFRFEVAEVTGADLNEVLEKCKKIALEQQNKAGRANPGIAFKKYSDLDLACSKGGQKFPVRRNLATVP